MHTFQSLQSPNFRRYFIGHSLSTLGTWIQQVALAWIIYELTNSAALLGVIGFCALIPQLVVSPIAGAWIDKLNKQKLLDQNISFHRYFLICGNSFFIILELADLYAFMNLVNSVLG